MLTRSPTPYLALLLSYRTWLCNLLRISVLFLAWPALAGIPPVTVDGKVVSLAPMLERVTPAVVNISVSTSTPLSQNPLFNDPFFRQFFGDFDGLGGLGGGGREQSQSAGSGVIVDAEKGIIVTNQHVIARARNISVTLKNRKTYAAQLIGLDAATDLAIIAIPVKSGELAAMPLGNSDVLEVGDFVAAIGNPFAIGQTVTSGIISALGRSGLNLKHFEDFIQTDAAINPGNSGGALVNLQGELIGINTSIISPAGASVGLGFAIPVNMVKAVVAQIREHGQVRRGYFGVEIQDLTEDLAQSLGMTLRDGALLLRVTRDSPAAAAGLQPGDLVVALNGVTVRSGNHLRSLLALIPPNAPMRIKVIRANKSLNLNGTMGESPRAGVTNRSNRPAPNATEKEVGDAAVGWELVEDREQKQVVVAKVAPESLAAQWGIAEGDRLLNVFGKNINTLADLPKTYTAQIDITVQRGGAVLRFIRR